MLGNLSFLNDSTGSIFHFFVSKTVYEGIQHGDDNSIKNRSHLVLSQRVGLIWFQVSENHSAVKDGYSQEMGGTGREGFPLPWSGNNFHDGEQDGHIGHGYCDKRHHQGTASNNEYHDFNVVCVSAGQG